MGTPDDPEGFVQFEVGDLTVYVARELLEKLKPGADRMPFYIDGYGRFWLVFSDGGES
ncbi:MAG TPA: hypothetical protein G4N97_08585 [Thermoflexia bacterium]|nr:hypothetical protein [Thermoflexia bacterium]